MSKSKSSNSSSDLSLNLYNSISIMSKASFLRAWKYSDTSLRLKQLLFWLETKPGRDQSKAASFPPGSVPACEPGTCFLSYMCAPVCIAPCLQKVMMLVIDFLQCSSSPNAVVVENGVLKDYKISP